LGLGRAARLSDVNTLAMRLPLLSGLSGAEREELSARSRVFEAPAGTAVLRLGETCDAVYFLLDGRTAASRAGEGNERVLEVHDAGDFFGEIAAITGEPWTANVVAEQPSTLLQVPAETFRRMTIDPVRHRLLLSRMTERMLRIGTHEVPRLVGPDQATVRALRTPDQESVVDYGTAPSAA
jgi:CRP-like cAMP-binding protein